MSDAEKKQSEIQAKIDALKKEAQELEENERERVREEKQKEETRKYEEEKRTAREKFKAETTPIVSSLVAEINRQNADANAGAHIDEREYAIEWRLKMFDKSTPFNIFRWRATRGTGFWAREYGESCWKIEAGEWKNKIRRREGKNGFSKSAFKDIAAHLISEKLREIKSEEAERQRRSAVEKFRPDFLALAGQYNDDGLVDYFSKYSPSMSIHDAEKKEVTVHLHVSLDKAAKILKIAFGK